MGNIGHNAAVFVAGGRELAHELVEAIVGRSQLGGNGAGASGTSFFATASRTGAPLASRCGDGPIQRVNAALYDAHHRHGNHRRPRKRGGSGNRPQARRLAIGVRIGCIRYKRRHKNQRARLPRNGFIRGLFYGLARTEQPFEQVEFTLREFLPASQQAPFHNRERGIEHAVILHMHARGILIVSAQDNGMHGPACGVFAFQNVVEATTSFVILQKRQIARAHIGGYYGVGGVQAVALSVEHRNLAVLGDRGGQRVEAVLLQIALVFEHGFHGGERILHAPVHRFERDEKQCGHKRDIDAHANKQPHREARRGKTGRLADAVAQQGHASPPGGTPSPAP